MSNYILYVAFAVVVNFTLLKIGPQMIKDGLRDDELVLDTIIIEEMYFDYLLGYKGNGLSLDIIVDGKKNGYYFRINENKYINLVDFLCKSDFYNDLDGFSCKLDSLKLPIVLTNEQIKSEGIVRGKYDEDGRLAYIEINGFPIVGKKEGKVKKIIEVIFGGFFILVSISLGILIIGKIIWDYNEYSRTGHLPESKNSLDSFIDRFSGKADEKDSESE